MNRPAAFGPDDIGLAEQVADSLAVAIQNARLLDELRTRHAQLKNLAHRLVQGQERERSYVANELYNDEGQRLAALLVQLSLAQREAAGNSSLLDRLSQMKELAHGVLTDLHTLAVDLRPASLDRLGLMPALRAYAADLCQRPARTSTSR